MILSNGAQRLISAIEGEGFEAYAVGGCVRDCLMKRECGDYDITTSAKPDELETLFDKLGIRYVETGLKHGTITAIIDDNSYEITTYRADGEYLDNRHPSDVHFVKNLREDLARRDFTMNAIAYNQSDGVVDLFDGKNDIDNRLIRSVGDANKRFNEDALRILRAIRFSSVLGFEIEEKTKRAIFDNKELLKHISAERIFNEISKTLMGDNVFNVLCEYKEVFGVAIPQLVQIFNVSQNTKWHIYDVWGHTAKSVECVKKDLALKWIMLFHDVGKADTIKTDENGIDHFKGHQAVSACCFEEAIKELKAPNEIYNRGMAVIPIHDITMSAERKNVKKLLSKLGEQAFRDLIEVMRADKLAHNILFVNEELAKLDIIEAQLNDIIESGDPVTVKALDINGNDLKQLGLKDREIGDTLKYLLNMVMNGEIENKKEALINYTEHNKKDILI